MTVVTKSLVKSSSSSSFLSLRGLRPVLYVIFFALLCVPLLISLPSTPVGTTWVTQHELTPEGLGAALMHLRKPIVLAQMINGCLHIPKVKSIHGYYTRQFFDPCPPRPLPARKKPCKVAVSLSGGKLLVTMPERGPVDPAVLRTCHTVEVINPNLRDYDNEYNGTDYIFNNLKRITNASLNCDGIDTVFHYRYGDIVRSSVLKESKQVHEDLVVNLISKGQINDSRLLIVTDPTGEKRIASKFQNARFFTENDPAALRECAGKADNFIGGGSTYAYLCYQLVKPKVVYTANLNAKSRVKFPVGITRVLKR